MKTTLETSIEISRQAAEEHGEGLYGLTSFGNESALLFDVLERAGIEVKFLTIDTGFWFPETHDFKDQLTGRYRRELEIAGPSVEVVADVWEAELWKTDIERYHEITKHEPLRRAIGELGITGLLAGVRAGQTATRGGLQTVEPGKDGEVRVHPLLHWTEAEAEEYFRRHHLLRHPLYYQGFGSIGDWTTTRPGEGREGRDLPGSECGLHVTDDGRPVRAAS